MFFNKSSFKREVYSDTILFQGTRKISTNLNLILKATKERRTKKTPKVSRREKAEINEIEIKKTITNNEKKTSSLKDKQNR